jgi:membrane-bound lytic murein transglycosylase A
MRRGRIGVSLIAFLMSAAGPGAAAPAAVGDAKLEPVAFADLAGWTQDDHAAAFAAFLRSCEAVAAGRPALRPAAATGDDLRAVCAAALESPGVDARAFFERRFEPFRIVPPSGQGFLTGYFEPEYEGSLTPDAAYPVPLIARPADLVTIPQGESLPGVEAGLQAARRAAAGYEPYPDRAAIEDGALGALAEPVAYLRDPVDALVIHVQGSARIRLPDGRIARVAYDGRNGHPFTAVGRLIVEAGHVPLEEMNLARMTDWLKAHPLEARALMRRNRSYIFFRLAPELDPREGPIGGAGLPLTPGRSLAIDRRLWSYGLPFWLEGRLPRPDGGFEPLARLMIAQDTGSAIVGPARGDFFFGSGPDAGTRAGLVRHPTGFVVLRPKRSLP